MYFKWTKYAEFGTELNIETIWHFLGFPKMDRTHTELEISPCILNGQSMPISAPNEYGNYILLAPSWISEDGPNSYRY